MRLSNEGLEIETPNVGVLFPADFIIVDWECEAVETFGDIESQKGYEFEDIEMECFYYNTDNKLIRYIPLGDQITWITPFIETDAENELEKQK